MEKKTYIIPGMEVELYDFHTLLKETSWAIDGNKPPVSIIEGNPTGEIDVKNEKGESQSWGDLW